MDAARKVGVLVAALCMVDMAATHYELVHRWATEANPVTAGLIAVSWWWVWGVKLGLASVLAATADKLCRTIFGCYALGAAAGVYISITALHISIFAQFMGL